VFANLLRLGQSKQIYLDTFRSCIEVLTKPHGLQEVPLTLTGFKVCLDMFSLIDVKNLGSFEEP